MYIVPGVSIVPMPLFRANVAFFDRKNGAYVKIWAIFTGGAAHFSPPGTHDREHSALIGHNPFPITADHHRAGIKRPRSAASRRGMKGGNMRGKGQNPLSGIIVPHSPFNDRLFTLCSHKWRQMSHLVRICRTCVYLSYGLLYTCAKWESGNPLSVLASPFSIWEWLRMTSVVTAPSSIFGGAWIM